MARVFTVEVTRADPGEPSGYYAAVKCNGKELLGDGWYESPDNAKDALIKMLAEELEDARDAIAKLGRECQKTAREAAKIVGVL
jgi:hypothetical protein